ncbi:hypothetical protein GMI70_00140 [Eggerthellaceae bacterium zg-893]|nr:hypothetical protein [Eggerthellaceae bacterium zg-893]
MLSKGRLVPNFFSAPYADVRVVGIPRALLFHRYGALWTTFFEALGRTVVVSEPTTRDTVAAGTALSTDESCLASKIFLGHVDELRERCDAVFVPCYDNEGARHAFCTKFQAAPDVVANTFCDPPVRVLSCSVNETADKQDARQAFLSLAMKLGAMPKQAKHAWKAAVRAQQEAEKAACARTKATFDAVRRAEEAGEAPLTILLAAHPYLTYDPSIGGTIAEMLRNLGANVVMACENDRKKTLAASFDFSETMPWIVNREIIGAITLLHDAVDGIVLVSAFPCGPDSMTDDAIVRCIQGKPILNLTVDAQSGTAGLETRVESFVDILRYQKRGGYIHGEA